MSEVERNLKDQRRLLRLFSQNCANTTKPGMYKLHRLKVHKYDQSITGCCAWRIMSLQSDFLAQKGRLHEGVEARCHMALFYPKFHCELNWMEYYWGKAKKYTPDNCT